VLAGFAHTPGSIGVSDDEQSLVCALAGDSSGTAPWWRWRAMADALAALQKPCYDGILCDLRMPERDGRVFYARLRQQAPALGQWGFFSLRLNQATQHWHTGVMCKRAIPVFLQHRVCESRVDRLSSAADHQAFLGIKDHGASREAPSLLGRSINDAETLWTLGATG
jgi:CheY-like chemotaxis protein